MDVVDVVVEELLEAAPELCVVPPVVFPSGSVGVLELPPPPPPQETKSTEKNETPPSWTTSEGCTVLKIFVRQPSRRIAGVPTRRNSKGN